MPYALTRRRAENQDLANSQRAGDRAGVLSAGSAERDKNVIGRVVSFRDRDFADGADHVGICDVDEPLGQLGGTKVASVGGLARFAGRGRSRRVSTASGREERETARGAACPEID